MNLMKTLIILLPLLALSTIITTGEEIKSEIGIKDISKPDFDLSLAHGKLISHNVQENPRLLSSAVYDLSTIDRGPLKANRVSVHFYASTLTSLPEEAILILHTLHYNVTRNTRTYCAIGLEAWRGVIPYSQEKWEEISRMQSSDLSRSAMKDRLPLKRALQTAYQQTRRFYKKDGISVLRTQVDKKILRNNFSWVIPVTVDTPDNTRSGIYWRSIDLVEITDTGDFLDYQPGRHATEIYEDGTYTDVKTALYARYTIDPKQAKGLTAHRVICKKDTFYIPEINLEDTYNAVSEWGFMEDEVSPMAQNCPYIQWVRSLDPEKDFVLFVENPDGQESPWKFLDAATARNGIRIGYSLHNF